MIANCFEIIELQQGTKEWSEWRRNGIGASDAPTIMGENPFKNINQLLTEKLNLSHKPFENYAMSIGSKLEPEARRRYIVKKGINVNPVCIKSVQYDWLRASLDGFDLSNKIAVEIKCGKSVYLKTAMARTVPKNYYGQLQHILAVTGFEVIDFFCFWPIYQDLLFSIKRNDEYIDRLLNKELDFWKSINKNA